MTAAQLNTRIFLLSYPAAILFYHLLPNLEARVFFPAIIPVCLISGYFLANYRNKGNFNKVGIAIFLSYLTISTIGLLATTKIDYYALRKLILPCVGLSVAAFQFEQTNKIVSILSLFIFLVALLFGGLITGTGVDTNLSGAFSSNWATESAYGVALCAAPIFLLSRESKSLTLIFYIFSIALAKRNGIIASTSIMLLYATFSRTLTSQILDQTLRVIATTLLITMCILSFNLLSVFEYIAHTLSGVSAEMVSTGRSTVYYVIQEDLKTSTLIELLLGHGTGSVERLITSTYFINPNINLAHSEYLSIFYDFGAVGFALFFGMLLIQSRTSRSNALIITYLFVIATVENFLITSFNMMFFCFLLTGHVKSKTEA